MSNTNSKTKVPSESVKLMRQEIDVNGALLRTNLPGTLFRSGKVRDTWDEVRSLLMVATDRISAFDVILPNGIPKKGELLTQLSLFWFDRTKNIIGNHLLSRDPASRYYFEKYQDYDQYLRNRTLIVKKAQILPIECVVRGYLEGTGLKDYKATGSVTGIKLPPGLERASKLPEPIFTPSTKEESGHDRNITFDEMKQILGDDGIANALRSVSLELYKSAADYALTRGIIIADTKFEFGLHGIDRELILVDEVLTQIPRDSGR